MAKAMLPSMDADSWHAGRAAGWDDGWNEGSKAQLQRINQLVKEKELLQQELDKLKSVTQSSPQTCVKRARIVTPRPLLCSLLLAPEPQPPVRMMLFQGDDHERPGIHEVLNDVDEDTGGDWYKSDLEEDLQVTCLYIDAEGRWERGDIDFIDIERAITGMAAYERGATEDGWLDDAAAYIHSANKDHKWLTYIASKDQTPREVAAEAGCQLALLVKLNRERPCMSNLTFNSALEANTILLVPPADMPHVLSRQRISTVTCDVCLTDTGCSYHCNMCDWDICLNCKATMSAEQLVARQCTSGEEEGEEDSNEEEGEEDRDEEEGEEDSDEEEGEEGSV
jgi:hypothetical protein